MSGSKSKVLERTGVALQGLSGIRDKIEFIVYTGEMGEAALKDTAFQYIVVGESTKDTTSAVDTRRAIELLQAESVHIILFSGGDGTARDICDTLQPGQVFKLSSKATETCSGLTSIRSSRNIV